MTPGRTEDDDPSASDTSHDRPPSYEKDRIPASEISYDINVPYRKQSEGYERFTRGRTEFPQYLPTWEPELFFQEFPTFKFHDPALRANKEKPHLFKPGVTARDVTPKMGTILTGVKLQDLSSEGKDELALLIVERKVVVLREQSEFLHSGPKFQQEFMSYFGKLSVQPVSGAVKGYPEFHIIHRDDNEDEIAKFLEHKSTSTLWHHDVSYERQPPGYIMLGILACPDVGGDTVFANTAEAYNRLSPEFRKFVDRLKAVHSSANMIAHTKAMNGIVRSDPIDSTHPIVRVHPVSGERAIFLNAEFLKSIVDLRDQEKEVITKFLMDHMIKGHDFQARVQWEKHAVVMIDGRTTLHTATIDYDSRVQARHLFRLAAMTEVPISVADSEHERTTYITYLD
ncbi:hypothetical protein B7494_g2095 [Chlorociboria aeruginascens]|nr:hypothetical protein B7494_g2095 [Chlorociboria aeruginascens]